MEKLGGHRLDGFSQFFARGGGMGVGGSKPIDRTPPINARVFSFFEVHRSPESPMLFDD